MTERNDLYCRRRAMQLVSQLPDHPATAMRIVAHMKALLSYTSGKTDDACMEPEADAAE